MQKPNIWFPISITATLILFLIIVLPLFSEYKNKNLSKETNIYQLKVNYPAKINAKVDHAIQAFINKQIRVFKRLPAPSPDDPRNYKNLLDITYDKPFITEKIVSLVFYVETYDGGAHPVTAVYTMNFNAKTGQKLKLADVAKLDKDLIKSMIVRQLMNTLAEPDQLWVSKGVTQSNLEQFTIHYNNITFYFGQYEVAPYAQGIQKVRFKLTDLN